MHFFINQYKFVSMEYAAKRTFFMHIV